MDEEVLTEDECLHPANALVAVREELASVRGALATVRGALAALEQRKAAVEITSAAINLIAGIRANDLSGEGALEAVMEMRRRVANMRASF